MRILLVNPPGWQSGSVSLGLGYLSGALLHEGHEVRVLDETGKNPDADGVAEKARQYAPDVIGFHCKTAQANAAAGISKAIKRVYPHARHVAGGPHITLCYEEFMRENPEFEFGFQGEADLNFAEYCGRLQTGESVANIAGIIFRNNGSITATERELILGLEELPRPNFDVIEGFAWNGFRYPLLTSRGCPYRCSFCSVPMISSRRFRYRSPEDCVDELARVKKDKGITCFEVLDDNFTLNMDRAKEFCRALIQSRLNLSWYCHNGIRADRLDQELADLMAKAGCTSIAFGIESGDQEVFHRIVKDEELHHIVQAIDVTKRAGMQTVGYFIIGLPGDSMKAFKKTLAFQKWLKLDHYVYGVFIPYPGTTGRETVLGEGSIIRDIKETSHFADRPQIAVEYPYFAKAEIEEAYYLAAAGELSDLIEKWKIKGPIENVIYVETNPPTHGYRRFVRWVNGGADLLINSVFDGSFETDKKEGWARDVFGYDHSLYRGRMILQLLRRFMQFRKRKYRLALFPFNRRKSILAAFFAIVRAEHTVLYDFTGSRFVEVSLHNPEFRRLLWRYLAGKVAGQRAGAGFLFIRLPARVFRFVWGCVRSIAEAVWVRVKHILFCARLLFFDRTE